MGLVTQANFYHFFGQERELELGDQIVIETESKEDRVALQFGQLLEVCQNIHHLPSSTFICCR